MRPTLRFAAILPFAAALALAACQGGGSGATPAVIPTSTPAPTPTPSPTPVPAPVLPAQSNYQATQTSAITMPTASGTATTPPLAIALPSSLPAGYAGSITIASANATIPAGTVVQTTVSNQAPPNLPVLDVRRTPLAVRGPRDNGTGTSGAAIAYVTLSFTNEAHFAAQPAFAFTLPPALAGVPNVQYWLASYDPLRSILGWQRAYEGPGTVNGATIAFAPAAVTTIFFANEPVYFALYAISTAASAPTPAPTVPAQPTPAPLAAAPAQLEFTSATDAPQNVTITDASAAYGGAYAVSSADATVATATISGKTLTVTPIGPGLTTLSVTTTDSRMLLIPVGVTTTATRVQ